MSCFAMANHYLEVSQTEMSLDETFKLQANDTSHFTDSSVSIELWRAALHLNEKMISYYYMQQNNNSIILYSLKLFRHKYMEVN